MTNLDRFDANSIMFEIAKAAPVLLLLAAFASFFCIGFFCVDYYEQLFSRFDGFSRPVAILIASIQELVRFGLLIASIRDFNDKRRFNGWLGLMMSLALVWHDINIANEIARSWSSDNPGAYLSILVFLILLGLGLEIRLILTVDFQKVKNTSENKKDITENQKYITYEKKSSNGVGTASEISHSS